MTMERRFNERYARDLLSDGLRVIESFRASGAFETHVRLTDAALRTEVTRDQLQFQRLANRDSLSTLGLGVRQLNAMRADVAPLLSAVSAFDSTMLRNVSNVISALNATPSALELNLARLAEEMLARDDLADASHSLAQADEFYHNAGDDYDYSLAIHCGVGALEQMARLLAGMPTKTLPQAVAALIRRRRITPHDGEQMLHAYGVRSATPGIGHGAGSTPQLVARFTLFRVKQGILTLLCAFEIGTDEE